MPRAIYRGGGINGGTPGYVVGGMGNPGFVGGIGPTPSPTPSIPGLIPFTMNGQADFPGLGSSGNGYGQNSNGIQLFAAVRQAGGRTFLYVSTQSPGTNGDSTTRDNFVLVTDQLLAAASAAAPWGKAGKVAWAGTKPLLAGESKDSYLAWYNVGAGAQCAKLNDTTGMLEGVIDLGLNFGAVPQIIYIAAASYETRTAGILKSQSPAGNNDGHVDPNEFLALSIPSLVDQNADGKYDVLDPTIAFRLTGQVMANSFTITWPSYPGRTYQVYYADLLGNPTIWHAAPAPNGVKTGTVNQATLSYTDPNALPLGRRFYKIQIQ